MRKVLMAFFLVGIAATAQAQFGVRAGFNSANFSNTNFEAKAGFHLGAYYSIGTDFISFEPGIQYSQKGYQATEAGTGRSVDEKLGYIDIPVLVRLNLIPSVNIFAGPQASLLASSVYKLGDDTFDSSAAIRGYDLGGVVGAQVKLPMGLNAQASYDFGLSSLNYYNTDVKNQVFKISLGYSFGSNNE
ncbi:porin family protein [Algoriphagus alkaliphilus]|nr:porin family protein [Algoriphagus alkaliphilus]MBA4301264.1 PorT family protein [Cyclobacterium sp.]